MSKLWGKRPSPSLVISILALFVALGGSAYAASKIGTNKIKNNAITSAKIKKNAITSAKIKNGAVTGAKVNAATLGTVPNATHASSADSATNATNATNFSRYSTSGLKKASIGQSVTLLTVGPFTFTGHCIDKGSGVFLAEVTVQTSAPHSFFNSNNSEFYAGNLEPGEGHLVTEYNAESSEPEWEGWYGYYNEFAAASPDGNFVLQGYSNSGVHAFGADCSFQVSYVNAA